MQIERRKRWVLGFIAGAVVIIFLLAIGLTGMKMSSGALLGIPPRSTQTIDSPVDLPDWAWAINFMRITLAVALVLFPVYLIYMLVNPQRRKHLLRDLVIFGFILFFFDRLRVLSDSFGNRAADMPAQQMAESFNDAQPQVPLNEFVNHPPGWIVGAVTVTVVLVVAGVIYGLLWLGLRRRRLEADTIVLVEREARDALQSIQTGGDLRSIIIQCYRSMVQAVKQERGIQREVHVTPEEFIHILTSRGLPDAPVRTLTHLFEDARYGQQLQGTQSMRHQLEAVGCLEEIIAACRKQKEAA